MRYTVVITPDTEDGGFVAECPEIPGCVSEGETLEEAMANIRDAIEGCLAVLKEKGNPKVKGKPPSSPTAPADALGPSIEVEV